MLPVVRQNRKLDAQNEKGIEEFELLARNMPGIARNSLGKWPGPAIPPPFLTKRVHVGVLYAIFPVHLDESASPEKWLQRTAPPQEHQFSKWNPGKGCLERKSLVRLLSFGA